MANSVDPDQTPRSAASDLGLHCLHRPIRPNTIIIIMVVNLSDKNWPYDLCNDRRLRSLLGANSFLLG